MSQRLKIIQLKNDKKAKGIWINKNSIGTVWINNIPYTYNADLVYKNDVTVDDIVEDSKPKNKKKKKIIVIKRK